MSYAIRIATAVLLSTISLFGCTRKSEYDNIATQIRSINDFYSPLFIRVSPDERYILQKRTVDDGYVIGVFDIAKGETAFEHKVLDDPISLTWLPGGREVSYFTYDRKSEKFNFAVLDIEKALSKPVSLPDNSTTAHSWSPDGRMLLFVAKEDSRRLSLHLIADGELAYFGNSTKIALISRSLIYQWSPDSKSIAFVAEDEPSKISILKLEGLTIEKHEVSGEITSLTWFQDNLNLVVASRLIDADYETVFTFNLPSTSSNMVPIPGEAHIHVLGMSGDSKFLIYMKNQDANVAIQSINLETRSIYGLDSGMGLNRTLGLSSGKDSIYILAAKSYVPGREINKINLHSNLSEKIYNVPTFETPCIPEQIMIGPPNNRFPILYWKSNHQKKNRSIVIKIHGGPHSQYKKSCQMTHATLLSHGIDIIEPNYHGTYGYGETFKNQLDLAKQDILQTIEYAKNTLNFAPSDIIVQAVSSGTKLTVEALADAPDSIGLMLLISPIYNIHGNGRAPRNIVVYHGEFDDLDLEGLALSRLEKFWGIKLNSPQQKWVVLEREEHSFKYIDSWIMLLSDTIKYSRKGLVDVKGSQ